MSVSLQEAGRPPYVIFKKVQLEDRTATINAGRYVSRTIDVAHVRQSGSKDSLEIEASDWLDRISKNPGYPREWVDGYKKAYELWKVGQEAPLNGSPIREWGAISPEQRDMLLHLTICTVEDLAAANESTLMRIGMGARELKQKAQTWLDTSKNVGKTAAEIDALRVENAAFRDELEKLRKMIYANQAPNYAASAVPNNGLQGVTAYIPVTPTIAAQTPVSEDPFA